jgi:carbon-monoxide dehydrogenase small subunit/isoquinoline 1-oxidoreductase alpha subunit/xanthine dehydrogenase YagT iron-sulfur-binding subunit
MTSATESSPPEPVAVDAEGKLTLRLTVNGREQTVRARAHWTLLEVLRTEVGLTGPREGCGVGMCGACTVIMDGRPVSGCLVLAPMADGADILTIEGMEAPDGTLHPIQQAYVDHTAFQCSYCTPGFILTTKALLEDDPDPSRDDAKAYLAGNLCRCGSYVKILDAVMDAKTRVRGA